MDKKFDQIAPKLGLAWVLSIVTLPFGFLFSGVFINALFGAVDGLRKYILFFAGVFGLYFLSVPMAMIYLCFGLVILLFLFFKSKNFTLFYSGLAGVGLFLFYMAGLFYYFHEAGYLDKDLVYQAIVSGYERVVELAKIPKDQQLKAEDLNLVVWQVPSIVGVFAGVLLFVVSIFENKSKAWLGLELKTYNSEKKNNFKLPDYFIWILIGSLAGSYIEWGSSQYGFKIIALNLLNVTLLCYFFQGFAVIFNFFEAFKVSRFSKVMVVFCFVLQFSIVTVIIGVLDFWFDFRDRFTKKSRQIKHRSGL